MQFIYDFSKIIGNVAGYGLPMSLCIVWLGVGYVNLGFLISLICGSTIACYTKDKVFKMLMKMVKEMEQMMD